MTMRSVSRWWTPSCRLRRALRWRHVGPWPGGSGRVAAIRRGGMGVPRRQEAIDRPGGRRRPPNSSLWGSPRMGCRFVAFRGARFPFGCCCVRRMQNKRAPKPSFAPVRSQSELSRSGKNAEKNPSCIKKETSLKCPVVSTRAMARWHQASSQITIGRRVPELARNYAASASNRDALLAIARTHHYSSF